MMLFDWLLSRSEIITKIKNSFKVVASDITKLNKIQNTTTCNLNNRISKLEGAIEILTSQTTRTTPTKTPRSNLKSTQKEILKKLDQQQLTKAITELINQGYKTSNIKDEIIERFNIKPTCFYKYLKIVKEDIISSVATRTTTTRSSRK